MTDNDPIDDRTRRSIEKAIKTLMNSRSYKYFEAMKTFMEYEPFYSIGVSLGALELAEYVQFERAFMHGKHPENESALMAAWKQSTERELIQFLNAFLSWCTSSKMMDVLGPLLVDLQKEGLLYEFLGSLKPDSNMFEAVTYKMKNQLLYGVKPFPHFEDFLFKTRMTEDNFVRYLEILKPMFTGKRGTEMFSLRNIDSWFRNLVTVTNVTGFLQRIYDGFDFVRFAIHRKSKLVYTGPHARDLLTFCLMKWRQEDKKNNTDPKKSYAVSLAETSATCDIGSPFWSIIASDFQFYQAFKDRYRRQSRDTYAYHWNHLCWMRRQRGRAAMRAVVYWLRVWRLYQAWSHHPARLSVALSRLSQDTASTRATMTGKVTSVEDGFPVESFQLLAVADYFDGL